MLYETILDAIGNTPLVKIPFKSAGSIYAKLEYLNPGGSIKDRSALFMIEEAEQKGLLKPGGTIIEASSGNQGIATALIGAVKGYTVIITVSEKISKEKLTTIQAYGAQVVVCPVTSFLEDPLSYHSKAKEIHAQTPNSFMLNQYFNTSNALAHYRMLGPEIWKQTEGKVTHFFAGAGSTGTLCGAGRYLKEQNPAIKVYGLDSINSFRATKGHPLPYHIDGLGMDFFTPIYNEAVVDEIITITDADALGMLKTLAHNFGFLVGPTSGAVSWAVQQIAPSLKKDDCVVMIFGDSGRAYLSKQFYTDHAKDTQMPLTHKTAQTTHEGIQ
jgi:cystathionine beta-synthase